MYVCLLTMITQAITAWFTNYYNRFIAKKSTIAESGQAESTVDEKDAVDRNAVEKVLRSLAIFSGDLSPKELYAQENRALLKERAQEILEERGDRFPKGAARNMALAESWNDLTSAEKNEWKERTRAMTEDVSR